MTDRNPPIKWRAIVRGVAIVYSVTFVSGLAFAFTGITPQTDHVAYPLLALLTSAVGVALALRVAETTRLSYLVAIGVGVWLLSSTSVFLGAQSFTGWVSSSAFIGTTLIPGPPSDGKKPRNTSSICRVLFIAHPASHSDAQKRLAR